MKKKLIKITNIIIIVIISLFLTSCLDGDIDVARLMEEPLEYSMPLGKCITEDIYGVLPEILPEYIGMYIEVNPVYGTKLRISNVEILPQMIMQAYNNPDNYVDIDFKNKFENQIKIYTYDDHEVLTLLIASDEGLYAREDKNSPVFRLPEYIYYIIESCLWQMGDEEVNMTETACSLVEPLSDWSVSDGTAKLELRIPHDVKTVLYAMYGNTEVIFVNYKIYSFVELTQQVKLYMLLSYEGYDETEDGFYLRYREVIPIQMLYSWVEGGFWALTEIKFTDYEEGKLTDTNVRKILPYQDTKTALEDLSDISTISLELRRQAMVYLSKTNRGSIEILEPK